MMRVSTHLGVAAIGLCCASAGAAPTAVRYELTAQSTLSVGCFNGCACPTTIELVQGSMLLRLIGIGDVVDFYEVRDVEWLLPARTPPMRVHGNGNYRVASPPVANIQYMDLGLSFGDATAVIAFHSDFDTRSNSFPGQIVIGLAMNNFGCFDQVFQITAARVVACSPADIASVGGSSGGFFAADGMLTGDDFVAFINAFAEENLLADITGIGGLPSRPDYRVTGDDFVAFINAFGAGCP